MFLSSEFKPGIFEPDTNEYLLSDPRTPMPWMHYLFNDEYVALVSVTGGGYSFHKSAKYKRILRMRPNNVPFDRPGRYIYIRNRNTGDFHSAGWAPVMKSLEEQTYECRLGAGFVSISSAYKGIETRLTYFVPRSENLEVWRLAISNKSADKLDLDLFTYAEFALWDAANDHDNYQYTYNIASCSASGNFIFHETSYAVRKFLGFFASSESPSSYDCDREKFIGPYNYEANPAGVQKGTLTDSSASGGNPCAAFAIPLTLEAGEEQELAFYLGTADTREDAKAAIARCTGKKALDAAFEEIKRYWNTIFGRLSVKTPDSGVNTVVGLWHPYQINATLALSRGPSIYEGGINRGIGYRDSNQDSLGPAYQVPDRVKKLLLSMLEYQLSDGHAWHGFFPGSKEGHGEKYSDDHLWLILSVANYLKETGDSSILDERIPYFDAKPESVLDHLRRALDFTQGDLGEHGLPHILHADWNDCINIKGPNNAGESVWTGFLFHRALLDFIEIATAAGKQKSAETARSYAAAIAKNVYAHAWNGKWFTRAFDDNGEPVGSDSNEYGKVYLNPQSWSVISEVASREDGIEAMDTIKEKLDSEYGVALLWPAYREVNLALGPITQYPPGLKENAGIFCHANTWVVIAECMLGRGERAYEYYRKLLPTAYNTRASLHRAEPYVYSQVIAGKEHPDFGLARNSWLTGTASWMFVAFTQHILGIRPGYDGLVIAPCIPQTWPGFSVRRRIRDAVYSIDVSNPGGVSCGVAEITVDGKRIDGNIIGYNKSGEVKVSVRLGK